ncbi:MAG: metal ABC transporter ATP-binding protein, partial [Acidobacteriota bacterium]|nr:metal ABC transporter ATP-binding protein [Acidobacteriota bacterium]
MSNPEAVRADGVWFSYDNEDPVLQDVSVSIPQGSIAAIIGPNGCGKTTLLKVLLGFLSPRKGTVRVLGKTPRQAREDMAYVPQRFTFDRNFPITVLEFLQLSHPGASPEKVSHYLGHLNIAETLHMKLGALSGGQLQRVLIERSMLGDPKVLFLDEPAAGIDIAGEQTFYELVLHLHREHGCTVVMVSHELNVVASYADLVLCLNRRLVCQGRPEQVLTPDTLAQLYG